MRTVYRDWAFWLFLFMGLGTFIFATLAAIQINQLVSMVDQLRRQMAVVKDQNIRSMRERDNLYQSLGRSESSLKRLETFVDAVKERAEKAEAARKKQESQK